MKLLNPKIEKYEHLDEKSRNLMLKTIEFFETKGKLKILDDDHKKVWYADFLELKKRKSVFDSHDSKRLRGE